MNIDDIDPPEANEDDAHGDEPSTSGGEPSHPERGAGQGEPGAGSDADGDAGLDTGEGGGLGLTEEFARIEAEIQRETGVPVGGEEPAPDEGSEGAPPEAGDEVPEAGTDEEWVIARPEGAQHPPDTEQEWAEVAGETEASQPAPAGADTPDTGQDTVEADALAVDGSVGAAPDDAEVAGDDAGQAAQASEDPYEEENSEDEDFEDEGSEDEGSEEEDSEEEDFEDEGSDEDLADGAAPEGDDAPVAAEAAPSTDATIVQPPSGGRPLIAPAPRPVVPSGVGAGIPEEELEDRVPSLWLRFLAGSVLIICAAATATAATGILFLEDLAARINPLPGVKEQLAQVDPGSPQTIMIIGSDRRSGTSKDDKRSDTTMLVRVDPEKEVLSLFSLPRDLKVDIPGVGVDKLNAAYTAGGSKLTVETVKRFMGDFSVNHVVEINFNGFADAVNAIDCVYIDVDRDYFNVNDGTVANDYADIDINSGYQRLCGLKALQYVRYRHTDTDLVRAARQQDFLREARQKVEPRELLGAINPFTSGGTGNELIDIFTEYTRSDIDDEQDVIGILKSFASMRDVPVNEVHFKGDIGGPDNPFVTSTDRQVQKAKDEFLNGVGSPGQRGGETSTEKPESDETKKKKKKDKDPTEGANVVETSSLSDAKFPTLADRLAADAKKNARRLKIPVFFPTMVVPGSSFSTGSRTYDYKNEEDEEESAYKTVFALNTGGLTEYYGVMGTTWEDPPILRNPSETREIDGREYLLFYDGDRLRQVGWQDKGATYWISNTLVQSIGEPEMLAMAVSMREV